MLNEKALMCIYNNIKNILFLRKDFKVVIYQNSILVIEYYVISERCNIYSQNR